MQLERAILTEFVGTFVFLLSIVATGNPWIIGATLAVMIFLAAPISGGHLNPAVSLMMLYNGTISLTVAVGYIIAQIAGGIVATVLYHKINIIKLI